MSTELFNILDHLVEQEEAHSRVLSGDASLVEETLGHTGQEATFARALEAEVPQDFLTGERREMLSAVSEGGTPALLALNLQNQQTQIESAESALSSMQDTIAALETAFSNQPEFVADKSAVRDSLDALEQIQKIQTAQPGNEAAAEALSQFSDLLSDEAIASFVDEVAPSVQSDGVGQRISELRDNYYRVTEASASKPIRPSDSLDVRDSDGGPIRGMGGFEEATLTPDGSVMLTGSEDGLAQGESRTLSVRPSRTAARAQDLPGKPDTDALKDTFRFEIWACLVLDLIEDIEGWYDTLMRQVRASLRAFDVMGKILKNRPIERAINELTQDIVQAGLDTLQTTVELGQAGAESLIPDQVYDWVDTLDEHVDLSSTASSMCAHEHTKYCSAARRIDAYRKRIDELWPTLELDTSEIADAIDIEGLLEGAHEEYVSIFSALDALDDKISKLKQKVCAWIKKRMQGTPRELGDLEDLAVLLLPLLVGLKDFLAAELATLAADSKILNEIQDRWKRLGLESDADKLGQGDVLGVLEGKTTWAGQAADRLDKMSIETQSRRANFRLRELAQASRAKDEQISTEHKFRNRMRRRRHQNTRLESARAIRRDARVEVDMMNKNEKVMEAQTPDEPHWSKPPVLSPEAKAAGGPIQFPESARPNLGQGVTRIQLHMENSRLALFRVERGSTSTIWVEAARDNPDYYKILASPNFERYR